MNKVALLIPHYNNFRGLVTSINSIDSSEFIDIVIVDDGSIIEKIDEDVLIKAFKANGTIKFLYLPENKGIEHALNHGLDYILKNNYQFTARLDVGDVCVGKRFEIQHKFLEDNKSIKFIGANANAFDMEGNFLFRYNFPLKHSEIKKRIYLNAVFVHPTFMFDNEIIKTVGYYPTNYKSAEDFAFAMKVVKHFITENLEECLVNVEINPNGISLSKRNQQIRSRLNVIKDNFYFGYYPLYGLFRNIIICIAPNKWIAAMKKVKKRNDRLH
ncbi:hypothetical protein ABH942_002797 [Flavobacterium sp. 28YEA47A]|uniref:glycosyltransferase n=1 Tax=Flavobacterium sp. 28YEA47A TaxID=3156276 RepID=UPI00351374D5